MIQLFKINFGLLLLSPVLCFAQDKEEIDPTATELWEPIPAKVTPGINGSAPSDAIILFNGSDLASFSDTDGKTADWEVDNGALTVSPGKGPIITKQKFADCQLHIEWRSPISDTDQGQNKGNSGVFLMGRYELQVLDSYENKTYVNGQASSIYKQYAPLVNATKAPGEWQTYDVIFTAPRFGASGQLISPARMTVLLNGVLVQNNVALLGPTEYRGIPKYVQHKDKAPLMLQDHTDLVSFRNIWIREL